MRWAQITVLPLLLILGTGKSFADPQPEHAPALVQAIQEAVQSAGTPASNDCDSEVGRCSRVTPEDALVDAFKPFTEKFAPITSDIKGLSQGNLKNLKTWLAQRRPGFQKYLQAAAKEARRLDRQLQVTHQTSSESALAIARTGSLLSLDELIRRGIAKPEGKFNRVTKYQYDGQIGEQDVVFLAITDPSADSGASFGNITLQFDKEELLNQGYFTPYAFGVGSPVDWGPMSYPVCKEDIKRSASTLKDAETLYRTHVLSGADDYREWLQISIAQVLWEREQPLDKWREKLKVLHKKGKSHGERCASTFFDKSADSSYHIQSSSPNYETRVKGYEACLHEGVPRSEFAELNKIFGQDFPDKMLSNVEYANSDLPKYFVGRSNGSKIGIQDVLQSYRGFARPLDGRSFFDSPTFGFWELKVPQAVSLSYLESVSIFEPDIAKRAALKDAFFALAKSQNRKIIEKDVSDGSVKLIFFKK